MKFLKRLKKATFTIVFFSKYSKEKEINFSLLSVVAFGFLILFFVSLFLYFTIGYYKKDLQCKRIPVLEERIAEYQLEFRKLALELKDVEERMIKLQLTENEIKALAGIEKKNKRTLALGGPETYYLKRLRGLEENTQQLILGTKRDLYRLREVLTRQEKSLHILEEFFKSREALLLHTPLGYPVRGWITSPYGYRRNPFTGAREFHEGVDIAAPIGTPIRAPANGVVTFAGRHGGYGKLIVIKHGYGFSTLYGHCGKVLVKPGERVKKGEIIAYVGSTGRSTAPHLHYEVRLRGVPINPYRYLKAGIILAKKQ